MSNNKSGNNKTNKNSSNKSGSNARAVSKKVSKAVSKMSLKTIIIALVCIIIVAAILLGVMYFVYPDFFKNLFNLSNGGSLPNDYIDGETMQVNFVNVGQGDCAIIKFPDGKSMIIDAGGNTLESGMSYTDSIDNVIASMEITKFDYLLLTHTDADHVTYMDNIIQDYEVLNIYRPAFLSKSEIPDRKTAVVTTNAYDNFVKSAKAEGANIYNNIGKIDIEGAGYSISMMSPNRAQYAIDIVGENPDAKESNIVSPMTLVRYGERSILFTGDAESKENGGNGGEELFYDVNYINEVIDCDVLKVGHHGSKASSSDKFLQFIDPEYAVISTGKNTHGHPSEEVLSKLTAYKDNRPDDDHIGIAKTYITQTDGTVELLVGANGGMKWTTTLY